MAFTIRRSEAGYLTSKYWLNTAFGGYSPCDNMNRGYTIPNCVGWAYGRFMECAGITKCNLPYCDAGRWWYEVGDRYPKGQTPKVGAVACYRDNTGAWGHVLIVEQVNSDGSFLTSESAYQGQLFIQQTLRPPYYTWSSQFTLQGFIYNTHLKNVSGSDIAANFVKTAKDMIGKRLNDVKSITSCGNIKWSAAFVCACAKRVGDILDAVIATSFNQEDMFRISVEKDYGTFLRGPQLGTASRPRAGDLVAFREKKRASSASMYAGDKVGIVVAVKGNEFTAVIGDMGSTSIMQSSVVSRTYPINNNTILGYYRPQWSLLDSSVLDVADSGLYTSAQLYTTQNTAEDAIIREVGYVDSSYKPSISPSKIRLSVVNYTDMLSAFVSHLNVMPSMADEGSASYNVIADGVESNAAKTVINYLVSKGFNAAAATACAANIYRESGFDTNALGDHGTAFGICQWRFGRASNMKAMVGANWSTNLSGQLDFFIHELSTSYPKVYNYLKNCDNTLDGAKGCIVYLVRDYEIPADPSGEIDLRQKKTAEYWSQIIVQKV